VVLLSGNLSTTQTVWDGKRLALRKLSPSVIAIEVITDISNETEITHVSMEYSTSGNVVVEALCYKPEGH
jgi:hypothetical protein